jgi:hypothetical protein
LSTNKISNIGIKYLALVLAALTNLYLSTNKISNIGIKYLALVLVALTDQAD